MWGLMTRLGLSLFVLVTLAMAILVVMMWVWPCIGLFIVLALAGAVVWRWRLSFGIGRAGTPGSKRLVQAAAQMGADAVKAREWTDEEREQCRQRTIASGVSANIKPGYAGGPWWTEAELALLGTMPDEHLAEQLGKSVEAVRSQRTRRGIPSAKDRRRREDI